MRRTRGCCRDSSPVYTSSTTSTSTSARSRASPGRGCFHGEAVGLDLERCAVLCRKRPPVPYDLLSIDVGIAPRLDVDGATEHAVPVKAHRGDWSHVGSGWRSACARVRGSCEWRSSARGAAGVELTLAMQHALSAPRAGRGRPLPRPGVPPLRRGPDSAADSQPGVHGDALRVFFPRGACTSISVRGSRGSTPGRLEVADGTSFEMDEVVWATAAAPPSWPAESGLAVDGAGFIAVDATLQSTSHRGVFAAGDVASVLEHPREKAGGVRRPPGQTARDEPAAGAPRQAVAAVPPAAPVPEPDRHRRPRRRVASRGPWSAEGAWVWRWKDWNRPPLHAAVHRSAGDGYGGGRCAAGAARAAGPGAPRRRARALGGRHALRRLRVQGRGHAAGPGRRPARAGAPGRRGGRSGRPGRRRGRLAAARQAAGAVGRRVPRDDRRSLAVRPDHREPLPERPLRDGGRALLGACDRHHPPRTRIEDGGPAGRPPVGSREGAERRWGRAGRRAHQRGRRSPARPLGERVHRSRRDSPQGRSAAGRPARPDQAESAPGRFSPPTCGARRRRAGWMARSGRCCSPTATRRARCAPTPGARAPT